MRVTVSILAAMLSLIPKLFFLTVTLIGAGFGTISDISVDGRRHSLTPDFKARPESSVVYDFLVDCAGLFWRVGGQAQYKAQTNPSTFPMIGVVLFLWVSGALPLGAWYLGCCQSRQEPSNVACGFQKPTEPIAVEHGVAIVERPASFMKQESAQDEKLEAKYPSFWAWLGAFALTCPIFLLIFFLIIR